MLYLETQHLILRDYRAEDFDDYYRLKSDPRTMYYLQDIQLFSEAEAREDFRAVLRYLERPDRRFYFFRVEQKGTQVQLGSAGYTVMQDTPRR